MARTRHVILQYNCFYYRLKVTLGNLHDNCNTASPSDQAVPKTENATPLIEYRNSLRHICLKGAMVIAPYNGSRWVCRANSAIKFITISNDYWVHLLLHRLSPHSLCIPAKVPLKVLILLDKNICAALHWFGSLLLAARRDCRAVACLSYVPGGWFRNST